MSASKQSLFNIPLFVFLCTFFLCFFFFISMYSSRQGENYISNLVYDEKKVLSSLTVTTQEIEAKTTDYIQKLDAAIKQFLQIQQRTYENTILAFDRLSELSDAIIFAHILSALAILHPSEDIRRAAEENKLKISKFVISALEQNKDVYLAFLAAAENKLIKKSLTPTQQFCINSLLDEFKRNGIHLPEHEREEFRKLVQDIEACAIRFTKNVAGQVSVVEVTKEELDGVSELFLQSLQKKDPNTYILTVDYPVYFTVMETCQNQETRKKLYHAFQNRGYSNNKQELMKLISLRQTLAKLLGFDTYAEYDLQNQMIQTKESAYAFLYELLGKAQKKVDQELEILLAEAEGLHVPLAQNRKLYPWDIAFLKNSYKKKAFNLDEERIAEYFSLEQTLPALFSLYEQFFSITFTIKKPEVLLYHEDLLLIQVSDTTTKEIIGHLLLDLHPRAHKYSHAAHTTLVPAVEIAAGKKTLPFSIVIANFPKPTEHTPSLLKRTDVQTFFHELGHALHAMFGKTEFASFSGTRTLRDFVETPSQMLEEWFYDPMVLKLVSKHYKTGEPLDDATITQIIACKNNLVGFWLKRQIFFSLLSLAYYNQQNDVVNLFEILKELYLTILNEILFYEQNHEYASFGHLTGYGAKYYGYLYSKIFALDLFETIKEKGLLNQEIGRLYKDLVLAKGGSANPLLLLETFLGRKPTMDAFIRDLEL